MFHLNWDPDPQPSHRVDQGAAAERLIVLVAIGLLVSFGLLGFLVVAG